MSAVIMQQVKDIANRFRFNPEFLGIEINDVDQAGALDSTMLHISARIGDIDVVNTLIGLGANINSTGDLGNIPLHEAVLCGKVKSVELLLFCGADKNICNKFDQTSLDMARLGGWKSIEILLK